MILIPKKQDNQRSLALPDQDVKGTEPKQLHGFRFLIIFAPDWGVAKR